LLAAFLLATRFVPLVAVFFGDFALTFFRERVFTAARVFVLRTAFFLAAAALVFFLALDFVLLLDFAMFPPPDSIH
jgi:hypothetical protein